MDFYAALKEAIQNDIGLANTILHMPAGMLVLCAVRVPGRRPLGTLIPFFAVVIVEVLNEGIDYINHGSCRWPETASILRKTQPRVY